MRAALTCIVFALGGATVQRFAAGLLLDRAAVQAGLTLERSNGQTEGQVNRLKSVTE